MILRKHKLPGLRAGRGWGRRSQGPLEETPALFSFACIEKLEGYSVGPSGQHFYTHSSLAKWTLLGKDQAISSYFSGLDQFVTSFLKCSQLKRDCSCNGKQELHSFTGVERKEKVGNGGSAWAHSSRVRTSRRQSLGGEGVAGVGGWGWRVASSSGSWCCRVKYRGPGTLLLQVTTGQA